MKRPFSRRHNTGARLTMLGFGIAGLVVALLILLRLFLPSAFFFLVTPVWTLGTNVNTTTGSIFGGFQSKEVLIAQNQTLASEVAKLKAENSVLAARSQDLTHLLGGQADTGIHILAGVLARPPMSPYDTLIVDGGSSDGIAVGSAVYAAGGAPIGEVQSVTRDTATITLLSTSGRQTNGWVGADRIPLTLSGEGAGAFTATLAKSAPVVAGDIVYVPGPGALPIGTVLRIDSDPSSPYESLDIKPLINIFSITWVEIGS